FLMGAAGGGRKLPCSPYLLKIYHIQHRAAGQYLPGMLPTINWLPAYRRGFRTYTAGQSLPAPLQPSPPAYLSGVALVPLLAAVLPYRASIRYATEGDSLLLPLPIFCRL